ncbi:MAG: Gfo/Idh/MocA family oxidoreductase [Planctomycetes bacterium]|nr:Gfo/Idh/MocA family oxidoreductase [Planctomycetota bacterium]
MGDVKVGVIGCGSIAEIAHFPSISRRQDAKLVAVCDVEARVAQAAASKWGAERWFTDYRKMFNESRLNAVVIATPNNFHRNQAVAAARAGVHVVVEKPLAVTNGEAWDIVKACRKAGVKLMVGCDRRFWIHNQWAKQLIEEGVIGKVLMSRAALHEHWHNYQNHVARTKFRLDCKVAGGAAINDTGAHAIDLLTWLNGSKVKRAVGVAKRLAMPETYTLCDDTALAMVEFENGAFGTISCNRFSHAVTQMTEICGTEGTIFTASDATNPFQSWPMAVYTNKQYTVDTLPKILKDYRWPELFWVEDIVNKTVRNRWIPICPPRYPSNYDRMTEHYLDCIINDKEPMVSGEDGARAVEVMCAAIKSMQTGGWVDLPLKEEVIPLHYERLPDEDRV